MTSSGKERQGLIPLRELVFLIAAKAGTTAQYAAGMLYDLIYNDPYWLLAALYEWHPSYGSRYLEDDQRFSQVVAVLKEWGQSDISQASLHGMDDGYHFGILDRIGFRQSEVLPLVEQIEESSSEVPTPAVTTSGSWPEWKCRLAELDCLTDREAAAALAGVDLSQFNTYYPDEREEYQYLRELIRRSCEGGSLPAKTVRVADDGNQEWIIKPGDFAMWCDSRGIPYPLPGRDYFAPSIAHMVGHGAPQAADSVIPDLECEIQRLRDELCAKEEELAMLVAELDKLRGDLLEGKRRTTALKIVGGIIKSAYGINIHADRLDGIGQVVSDLDQVGVVLTEKTLREFIKDAAEVIEQPKKS